MSDQKVRVEIDGGVATVFLVNPPMNVMTLDMRRRVGRGPDQPGG